MNELCIRDVARIAGGRLSLSSLPPLGGELEPVARIVADVREVRAGDVFLALETGDHDLAARAEEAYTRDALGVVTAGRRVEPWAGKFSILVDDTRWALWELARWTRRQSAARVIAVTGSVGKTTACSLIDTVLREHHAGWQSPRGLPDALGLPLSLLNLRPEHDYGLLEFHGTEKSEIRTLSHLCSPEIGVINCTANEPLTAGEDAAAALLESLPSRGWAVLNGDEPGLCDLADRTEAEVVLVGRGSHCQLSAVDVRSRPGELTFAIGRTPFRVPLAGRHALPAALAACGVGVVMGMDLPEIAAQLERCEPLRQRCEVRRQNGVVVIDDTYDWRPVSLRAALALLRDVGEVQRRIVVCGDLPEDDACGRSRGGVGQAVVTECGADWLIACGGSGRAVIESAREAGMPARRAIWCQGLDEAERVVANLVRAGDAVLIRGGSSLAMDQVVAGLLQTALVAAA